MCFLSLPEQKFSCSKLSVLNFSALQPSIVDRKDADLVNANFFSKIITMRFDKVANTPYITDVFVTHEPSTGDDERTRVQRTITTIK